MAIRQSKTKEFLAEAAELVRMQLPPELRDPCLVGPVGTLVKLHYGDPKVHYEVWVRRRIGVIETGLHFEGALEDNLRYLQELTERYHDAILSLGPGVVAERWAGAWARVHQPIPFSALDEDTLMVVAGRLAQMVRVLEPAVRAIADTAPAGDGARGDGMAVPPQPGGFVGIGSRPGDVAGASRRRTTRVRRSRGEP